MINKGIDPTTGQATLIENFYADEKTDRRIQEHFSNVDDVISEKDIENVKTDFGENPPIIINHDPAPLGDLTDATKKDINEEENSKEPEPIVSSWNILS